MNPNSLPVFEPEVRRIEGVLLNSEHHETIDAMRQRDVTRADQLARAHVWQFATLLSTS